MIAEIVKIIYLQENNLIYGRKKIGKYYVCSGGFLAEKNDLIVDNFQKPAFIIGVSDGQGGFLKRINTTFKLKNIEKIKIS